MMITLSYKNAVFRITDISLMLEKLYHYLNQQKNVKESSLTISKIIVDPIVFKFVIIDLLKELVS
jgi:poly(3-hydroxyalkanoate) synthetase